MFTQLHVIGSYFIGRDSPFIGNSICGSRMFIPDLESGYFSILDSGSRILDQTKKRGEKFKIPSSLTLKAQTEGGHKLNKVEIIKFFKRQRKKFEEIDKEFKHF